MTCTCAELKSFIEECIVLCMHLTFERLALYKQGQETLDMVGVHAQSMATNLNAH